MGNEILSETFTRNIAKISVREAVDFSVNAFARAGLDLLAEIPEFEENVKRLKQKMTLALDIPREQMPVIEPEDIRRFVADIQGGFVDIFPPWADLSELPAEIHFEQYPEMLGGDKGKRWTSLGQRDGDLVDDQVRAKIQMVPVGELKPLQRQIFFENVIGNMLKFGIPEPGVRGTYMAVADRRTIRYVGHTPLGTSSLERKRRCSRYPAINSVGAWLRVRY